jgi:hypothetical protein
MTWTRRYRGVPLKNHDARGYRNYPAWALVVFLCTSGAVVADQASEVAALESQCAAAREARIKPLREAEVAKCKASRPDDPAYCDRYWSDYGNAKRLPNGTMSPRMFDDLPICVQATQARQALNQSGR